MIETIAKDNNLLEAEFYSKKFYFSYSSMNKLLLSPSVFYKEYILKQKDDEHKKYLLEGTLIHFLVLEDQARFDDHFIVSSENLPSANSIAVVENIFNIYQQQDNKSLELKDFEDEVDQALTDLNLHQHIKDPAKRLAKIVEPKAEQYFNFLKNKGDKTIIDSELLDKCTQRAEIVKSNKQIMDLLGAHLECDHKTCAVYNELKLQYAEDEWGYKGILDNVVIDVPSKTVRINDFKTSSKPLDQFTDAVEYWNYWLQAIVYLKLIRNFLEEKVKVDPDKWNIEFRFIVFDRYDQLYPFKVSDSTVKDWENNFKIIIEDIKYHMISRDFTLPAKFAKGNVEL